MSTPITNASQFVRLSDLEQSFNLRQIRAQTGALIPSAPTEDMIEYLGYALIHPTTPPEGDVVTAGPAQDVDGRWEQTWNVREYTSEELEVNLTRAKENHLQRLDESVTRTLTRGVAYVFPDDSTCHVQIDTDSRANLAGLRIRADALVAAGDTEAQLYFMPYENDLKQINPAQAIQLSDAAFSGFMGLLGSKWGLRAQIQGAASIEALPEIPEYIE